MQQKNEVDIVLILSRGEAIRNFVYTNTLKELAKKSRVTVLSVIPDEDTKDLIMQSRCERLIELKNIQERWIVSKLRELLINAHDRWLWSEAIRSKRWVFRDLKARTYKQKANRWLVKLVSLAFSRGVGLNVFSKFESRITYLLRTTEEYAKLFRHIKPAIVFNGSHVHSEVAIQAVSAARALNIPTAAFIFSWDNLTSRSRIIPPYDYHFVWNTSIKEQMMKIYKALDPRRIYVTGTPQFDFHFMKKFRWTREDFCARVAADPNRPIILYTTGMPEHMPGEPLIVKKISLMLRDMQSLGPPQLLVRLYPKDQSGRFNQLKKELPDVLFPEIPWNSNWNTPKYEDCFLLSNMLQHAALGINVASTVSLELCMFGKPVINVGYNPPGVNTGPINYASYYNYDHYRPVADSGAVAIAGSETDMQNMIYEALTKPEVGSDKRKRLIESMFGNTLDGHSGYRVAENLLKLAIT